jgi:predicted RNase H-like HicB family nuclease
VYNELRLTIETELEKDGRWLAEVPELPGVMTYGESPDGAIDRAVALALRVIADEIEHGERRADDLASIFLLPPKRSGFSSASRC